MAMIHDSRDAVWNGMPAKRVFGLWMRYACTAFYAHPVAWNEIGFGGPAYPRGYKNIGIGRRERWEVAEHGAEDPVPWARRAEAARRRHAGRFAGTSMGSGLHEYMPATTPTFTLPSVCVVTPVFEDSGFSASFVGSIVAMWLGG